MMHTGLVAGFGQPLGASRLADIQAHGFTLVRQDLQRRSNPNIPAVLAEAAAWSGRTVFICDEQTIYDVPDGAWIELFNEPDLNGFTPSAWVRAAEAVRYYIENHKLTLWGGGNSNLSQTSLRWLREVVQRAPWLTHITSHRYSPTAHQERLLAHNGFSVRADEVNALVAITGTRPLLIGEVGFHMQKVTTGWWIFKKTTQLTADQQAQMLLDELSFWQRCGVEACVLFQEQDSPDPNTIDKYGVRYAHAPDGTPGPWKTSTIYGAAPVVVPDRAIAIIVCDQDGTRIANASVEMQVSSVFWQMGLTDLDGVVTWSEIDGSLAASHLTVKAEGYKDVSTHIDLTPHINQQVWLGPGSQQATSLNLPGMVLAHVDPRVFTLAQLEKVRGGMWVNRAAIPYGPRPMDSTNINAMDYYEHYAPEYRARMVKNYLAAGYTHAVTGPLIDPGGYHGHYPTSPNAPTQAEWDHYLDCMQEWWDAGICPVHFALPDHPAWTIDDATVAMEPFFRQERAQRLLRFLVLAWEPSPWRNADYVRVAKWLTTTLFPNALVYVHLEPDHNAPGLSSEIADGSLTEAQMWANLAPYIHGFFPQTGSLLNNDPSDDEEFYEMFDRSVPGSWDSRFLDGYHGWPTFSATPGRGIWTIPSEYKSYKDYWENEPESIAQACGDELMRRGAHGYLDGGTVAVP